MFRMYYCGVCRSIGKFYGQIPRFGLTNETGMLAMILDIVCATNDNVKTVRKGCIAHPYKKSLSVVNNGCVNYAALVNVLLVYHKLKDNWVDDKNVLAQSLSLITTRAFRKANKTQKGLSNEISDSLKQLSQLEKDGCPSIDRAADPFANIMRHIFTKYPYLPENKFALMDKLGYNIGKWIYLIDALSDLEEDIKNSNYNCLLFKYNYVKNEDINLFRERISDNLRFTFEMCLASIAEAWENLKDFFNNSLQTKDAKAFMDNVIYIGMRQKTNVQLNIANRGDDSVGKPL